MRAPRGMPLVAALSLGCAASPGRELPAPTPPTPTPTVAPAAPLPSAAAAPSPTATALDPVACGALGCRLYATPTEAFRAVLARAPRVLAVGEAHARKDVPGVPSSARRFTAEMLPELKDRASDLVIELMVPPTGCEPSTKTVRKELGKVTEKQADTNQNEYVTMGDRAHALGVAPHLLHPSCADFKALGAAGADGVDAALRLIGRLMRESAEKLLARNAREGVDRMIVLYGGAIHDDVAPAEATRPYAFGPDLVAATQGRYVALDVFVPEFIGDAGMWTRFAWYPHFDRKAHPEQATLFAPTPASFTLLLPATKG